MRSYLVAKLVMKNLPLVNHLSLWLQFAVAWVMVSLAILFRQSLKSQTHYFSFDCMFLRSRSQYLRVWVLVHRPSWAIGYHQTHYSRTYQIRDQTLLKNHRRCTLHLSSFSTIILLALLTEQPLLISSLLLSYMLHNPQTPLH